MIAIKTFQDCEHTYLSPEEPGSQRKEAAIREREGVGGGRLGFVWEALGDANSIRIVEERKGAGQRQKS